MKRTLCNISIIAIAISTSALASSTQTTQDWNKHQGNYLGIRLGYNLVSASFYKYTTSAHAVSEELMGGHLFTPNWGFEIGVGSYFSGMA